MPLGIGFWGDVDVDTVVNPEAKDLCNLDENFEYANQSTSDGRGA